MDLSSIKSLLVSGIQGIIGLIESLSTQFNVSSFILLIALSFILGYLLTMFKWQFESRSAWRVALVYGLFILIIFILGSNS